MPAVVTAGTILTLDAAGDECAAGLVVDGVAVAERVQAGGRGSAASLPALVQDVLREAGIAGPVAVAVTVGPGSFTGVRAALALAHGIGLGAGVPVRGARVGNAIRAAIAGSWGAPVGALWGASIWVATDSRRGRVFLDTGTEVLAVALDALLRPPGPVVVAGDAAQAVAARLAEQGVEVRVSPEARPRPAGIAAAADGPALPFYVDPPEARPNRPLRPVPA